LTAEKWKKVYEAISKSYTMSQKAFLRDTDIVAVEAEVVNVFREVFS